MFERRIKIALQFLWIDRCHPVDDLGVLAEAKIILLFPAIGFLTDANDGDGVDKLPLRQARIERPPVCELGLRVQVDADRLSGLPVETLLSGSLCVPKGTGSWFRLWHSAAMTYALLRATYPNLYAPTTWFIAAAAMCNSFVGFNHLASSSNFAPMLPALVLASFRSYG